MHVPEEQSLSSHLHICPEGHQFPVEHDPPPEKSNCFFDPLIDCCSFLFNTEPRSEIFFNMI